MRRIGLIVILAMLSAGLTASAAHAAFGVQRFNLGFSNQDGSVATQAGSHPFAVINEIAFNTTTDPELGEVPDGAVRNVEVSLPQGLVGRPGSLPYCASADFINFNQEDKIPRCSNSSVVGLVIVKLLKNPVERLYLNAPVYNLAPPPGVVQKLGFIAQGVPVTIEFTVNQTAPYNVIAHLRNIAQPLPIFSSKLIIWGNPASPIHDAERGRCLNASELFLDESVHTRGELCTTDVAEQPYVTLPTQCVNPLTSEFFADSWQGGLSGPTLFDGGLLTGCGKNTFAPTVAAVPTTSSARVSTGLNFSLNVADEGLTSPTGLAQSDIRKTEVTLPEGMTVNPSLAEGLGACTLADLGRETLTRRRAKAARSPRRSARSKSKRRSSKNRRTAASTWRSRLKTNSARSSRSTS